MSKSLRFVRFTNWNHLKHLSRDLLKRLVEPFRKEIAEKGMAVPEESMKDKDYYAGWTKVFTHPETLPEDLTETLITIDEMSTEMAHENLLEQMELDGINVSLGEKPSAMDVAVHVHLDKPDYLKEKHSEEKLRKLRSFVHFLPAPGVEQIEFKEPPQKECDKLSDRLRPFFKKKVKGEYVEVTCHPMDGEFWFIVVHGETMARTMEVENDKKPKALRYRPETDDVLVYNPGSNSLRINAGALGLRKEYAKQFGGLFFGNEGYFQFSEKYKFDPVRSGRVAFNDVEVDGVKEVILRELRVYRGWNQHAVVTVRADDVFSLVENDNFRLGADTLIQKVTMDFVLTGDEERPRTVKIVDENTLSIGRACDHALIEEWLLKAGFIVCEDADEN